MLRFKHIRAFELFVFEFIRRGKKSSFGPYDDQDLTLNMDSTEKLNSSSELFSNKIVKRGKLILGIKYLSVYHTCQPPEFQNLETSRNPRVVRMRFTTMSEYSPRITRRLSECSRCVLRQCPNALRESPEGFPNLPDISP